MHHLVREFFLPTLRAIDRRLPATDPADVPRLLAPIPLSVWGLLTLDVPEELPNLRALVPRMPPEDLQVRWVGASGLALLHQSLAFVQGLMHAHRRWGNARPAGRLRILDHGCGWGRHLRLLFRFVPETGLHGVDTDAAILDLARRLGVRATLAPIAPRPEALPFPGGFDVIYAFSILTHLSEGAHRAALALWRRSIAEDGLLAVTIRPRAYWGLDPARPGLDRLLADHDRAGFADTGRAPGMPERDYGDTSISFGYIRRNWTEWRIAGIDASLLDPYQVVVYLRPA